MVRLLAAAKGQFDDAVRAELLKCTEALGPEVLAELRRRAHTVRCGATFHERHNRSSERHRANDSVRVHVRVNEVSHVHDTARGQTNDKVTMTLCE